MICLNSVDSIGLDSLPVFGPVLIYRTIKFRDALGGFYNALINSKMFRSR